MIYKTPSIKNDCVRIVFELPACLWADRIFLVGDFNDWSKSVTPFVQSRDGVWRAMIDLPAGHEYQFRYLVDGNWQTDYHADGWVHNEYGSQNSIVHAVLPPETVPTIGAASLLREGLQSPGALRAWVTAQSHPMTPLTSEAPSRFFADPIRATG